ncbi:aconitate hydratase AcnA [candidate division KSB1 bacterium]|nr:aconitate hydratase AcnA [candidate division KSB1 bacterium]
MSKANKNSFGARLPFQAPSGIAYMYSLEKLEKDGLGQISRLPFSIKVLLESLLRNCDDFQVMQEDVKKLAAWDAKAAAQQEIPFKPARVVLQDFTGVPSLVDLAAMRSAMQRLGGDPAKIEPLIPADLVVDHSVQIDSFGSADSLSENMKIEFQRNAERYTFLKWGQQAFEKFSVVPPGVGIIHQVNLEYLAKGVFSADENGMQVVYPDSLVGTDSHTTMINGLGIVGWGVGGIEAEAVMLGQPIYMLAPQVIGFKLVGTLPEGVTATDMTLTAVEMLRAKGVVGKFVEFYGPGLDTMSLPDRAMLANMAPEYGATMGFFPMDAESMDYMRRSGRPNAHVQLVENYLKAQGMFRSAESPEPVFTDTMELDLSTVQPSLAGPKRPQDRITVPAMGKAFQKSLQAPTNERGFALSGDKLNRSAVMNNKNGGVKMKHGSVVIAAITSCTNTSNPSVLLGAGLVAKKAVEKGLKVPEYVKTSLAPGSRVVTEYLQQTGLTPYLEKLGFHTVGYGCTTCIGNSGPLPEPVVAAINEGDLVAASVLSGNRNFEGRVNPHVKANYLASPPLVIAYALAGTVDIDLTKEPIGKGSDGTDIYLQDIWPSSAEIGALLETASNPENFTRMYADVNAFSKEWKDVKTTAGDIYAWDPDSTYVQEPPFFVDLQPEPEAISAIKNARVLALLGDSVTTDHISPAGAIPADSPAARFLNENGVERKDFNSFGSRRGNDRIMVRGTFANIRLKNLLVPGIEGGVTLKMPEDKQTSIYDAAMAYKEEGTPLVVLAGKEYGTGSSRDWAAKGTFLLGVKSVIAESFERIHRSNLVGMGVLPLQFKDGESAVSLGLNGHEKFSIAINDNLKPLQDVTVTATRDDGDTKQFTATVRIDTPVEISYYRNGGILQTVLRSMLKN